MKFCLDANIWITAWEVVYPIDIFPSLWNQLATHRDELSMLKIIYHEIHPGYAAYKSTLRHAARKSKLTNEKLEEKLEEKFPLRYWLEKNYLPAVSDRLVETSDQIKSISLKMQHKYGLTKKTSASPNDIHLIAYAKTKNICGEPHTVVTYESKQKELPKSKSNYKIPAICEKEEVPCITLVEMLRDLKVEI